MLPAYNSILEALDNHNIKYHIFNFEDYDVLRTNKTYSLSSMAAHINYPKEIFDFYSFYANNKGIKPYRKVFISRKRIGERPAPSNANWIKIKNDNRIDDYLKVEEYFSSLGFEIVYAEDFQNFKDQFNLFYEAEIIVGTSGSGLTNGIFMQEGTTMVEILTPLIVGIPPFMIDNNYDLMGQEPNNVNTYVSVEEIHYFYNLISFHKKQKYISIPNLERKTSQIKDLIESDGYMRDFLHREGKADTGHKWFKWSK